MTKFRVALSGDFLKPDGTAAYPDFDQSPLLDHPDIETQFVDPVDGAMPRDGLVGFDALILLAPRFTAGSIPRDGRLAMVARFGVGYDNVDLEACSRHGIAVVITPDGIRRPVAVTVLTFMLALSGKLMVKDRLTRRGPEGWAQRSDHMGIGLTGKTLGLLGMGNIGAEVFRLALPLDMRFIAHDPYADAGQAEQLGVELVDLDRLFAESDFLSVNCPLTEATHGLVDAARLAQMKSSAFLINTARGPVVDQPALTEALQAGRIAGAGLDVFEVEPVPVDEPLLRLDNVVLAPHALCWTDECFAGNGAADVRAALALMQGHAPTGVVNRDVLDSGAWQAKLDTLRERFGEAREA